ncbi:glycosyl transferase family 1 [Roseimicrobium gellanilyticum]|uniref:Glycosyl transferase family 1 n=1 Tax=Roseimicrobium gellanilyticum TaxID=748857 RepID=A0A366HR71_9BACT|nr:glycosyltransferase [Roseimicrobium gellanilyticum]RBP45308.1 glycosyl transferase family 1 [Roseimicrobium gellanilyticum]
MHEASEFDPHVPPPRGEGRVVIFSRRRFSQKVYRSAFYEFENVIGTVDDVDYHAPAMLRARSASYLASRMADKIKFRLGLPSPPTTQVEESHLPGTYELGFAIFEYASEIPTIRSIANWKKNCRKTVCYLGEHWPHEFSKPQKRACFELLGQFDFIICHCPQVGQLESLTGRPCHHLPVGIDALRFCPRSLNAPRPIEVFSMGRRSPAIHQALMRDAEAGRVFYLYDTAAGFDVMNWREHRELIANNIKRSEFFVSFKHNVSLESLTGGVEAVGARLFEGAAGGAIQIGMAPDCDTFREYFDWEDAVIPMPYDCTHPLEFIKDLRWQPERLAAARRNSISNTLRRHDWSQRWKRILQLVDMPPMESLTQREKELARAECNLQGN